jgi:hypothetical protein
VYLQDSVGKLVHVMFEYFTQAIWSPYMAGAGIGISGCESTTLLSTFSVDPVINT